MVKNLPASAGSARDTGSILGSGRSPGVGNGNLLQYSCIGELGGLQSTGSKELDTTEHVCTILSRTIHVAPTGIISFFFFLFMFLNICIISMHLFFNTEF